MFKRALILLTAWCLAASALAQPKEITLYAYHLKPPYIIDPDKGIGLYFDLAQYLNERTSAFQFKTVYLPRRRLEADLELGRLKGLVVGVNPLWFKDEARTRYLWSPAFMHDEDVVVSLASKPIVYEGPDSLVGKTVGLPLGYYYYGVDELVKAGRITRDDAASEGTSLKKLAAKRLDAAIVSRPTLEYYEKHEPKWANGFFVAQVPHDSFDRFILLPKEYADVLPDLNAALGGIARDPAWKAIIKRDEK